VRDIYAAAAVMQTLNGKLIQGGGKLSVRIIWETLA